MGTNLNTSIIGIIKIAAIVFSLVHLLAGFILIRQMSRMNTIIKTPNRHFINFVGLIYALVLISVFVFIVLLPV